MFVFVLFLCLFFSLFLFSLFLGIIPASFSRLKPRKSCLLKTELDLYRAEMETERQTHQREEQALHARVVEAEERRDAAVQEALKNVEAMKNMEAMKKECNGIAGSFFSFCIQISLSADLFFGAWSSSPS